MSNWDLDDVLSIQPRRRSQRDLLQNVLKHVSPRRPRRDALRSGKDQPDLNLARRGSSRRGSSHRTSDTAELDEYADVEEEPTATANGGVGPCRPGGPSPVQISTADGDLAPLNIQGASGLKLGRLTPSTPASARAPTPHASLGSRASSRRTTPRFAFPSPSPGASVGSSHSIEPREVVHGAWPRSMTLQMAVRSLTDPKCVIDQQCHLAFLLCLPCFATAYTAQPLFQHQESIQCVLYNSIDDFVRYVRAEFDPTGETLAGNGAQGDAATDNNSEAGVEEGKRAGASTAPAAARPHIQTIIRRAKVMKLLSLWTAQRGGEADLTNHQAARAQIVRMLTRCPSMVPRNRAIAAGLVERIRMVNQNSLRTVVTIVHALHQRVGQVVAPKILDIFKNKLSERFGAHTVSYHWASIVAVLRERPTRSLGHLRSAGRGPTTASTSASGSGDAQGQAAAEGDQGGSRVSGGGRDGAAVHSMEAEIIRLPKPWWEYKMLGVDGGDADVGAATVVWRCEIDHIAVRDHPTRWSKVLCHLGVREDVREVTRIYADFHYWIRVFVIDEEGGDLQAGWVCIDDYYDSFHPDFWCAETRELAPGPSVERSFSSGSMQGGVSRRSSLTSMRRGTSGGGSVSSLASMDSLVNLYHNVKSNNRLAREHDLSTSLLASVIMNPSKHRDFAKILAAQLTLIDVGVLKRMQLRELIGQRWTKKFKNDESPFVLELTRDYNNRVSWVVRLLQGNTHKYRRLAYSFMVQLADELLDSGNFNAAGQIGHGFASPALGRLDIFHNRFEKSKPAAVALQKRIEFLKTLFSDKDNYARYRLEYAFRAEECAFMVPCWGIFLGDVFKLDDRDPWIVGKCPTTGNALLNLPKASEMFSMLSQTLRVKDMTDASKMLRPHVGLAADIQREVEHSTCFIDQLKKQRALNAEKERKNNSRINKLKDLGYMI